MRACAVGIIVLALVSPSCNSHGSGSIQQHQAPTPVIAGLIDSLSRLEGRYALVGAQQQFEGNQALFMAIGEHGDSAVAALVGCLDDSRASRVTNDSGRVLVGALCGMALQRMAYATEHEDSDTPWPGVVTPDMDASRLRAAKTAWQDVQKRRAYRLS